MNRMHNAEQTHPADILPNAAPLTDDREERHI